MTKDKTIIEGNMDLEDEGDSSSDESNEPTYEEKYKGYMDEFDSQNMQPDTQEQDEDEEEIEIFDGKSGSSVLKNKSKKVLSSQLKSVSPSNFESQQENANMPLKSTPTPVKKEPVEVQMGPDEFGINYKRYDIDALVENVKLLQSQAEIQPKKKEVIVDDEDDEFAVFENEDQSQVQQAIQHALQSVELHESTQIINEDGQVDFSDVMPVQNKVAAILQDTLFPAQYTATSLDEPMIINNDDHTSHKSHSKLPMTGDVANAAVSGSHGSYVIADEAKKAFEDIVGVYGNGMGDQEILLLDMILEEQDKKLDHQDLNNLGVILEGEEDEEEEETGHIIPLHQPIESATTIANKNGPATPAAAVVMKSKAELEFDAYLLKEGSIVAAEKVTTTNPSSSASTTTTTIPIEYPTAITYFHTLDYTPYQDKIILYEPSAANTTSSASFFKLFGTSSGDSTKLTYPNSEEDLKFVFNIAQIDYNPMTVEHCVMLNTIYFKLMNLTFPHSSTHLLQGIDERWENIGFQGRDPTTDLNRSMKMLSIVQLLHFIQTNPVLVQQLFVLSESASNRSKELIRGQFDASWPFLCVAVMFTRESLQLLRAGGIFYDLCNKAQNVLEVVCQFHHACFAEFGRMLLKEPTKHHAIHLAALRELCTKSPLKIWKEYHSKYVLPIKQQQQQQAIPAPVSSVTTKKATTSKSDNNKNDLEKEKLTNLDTLVDFDNSTTNNTDSTSRWNNLFGGSKASKFAAQ